jgi:hypothetical protein
MNGPIQLQPVLYSAATATLPARQRYKFRSPNAPIARQQWNAVDDAGRRDQLIRRIAQKIQFRGLPDSNLRSAGVSEPSRANGRMWVSRFNIPLESRKKNITLHFYFVLHAADQVRTTGRNWNQPRNWLPVLCNDDAVRIETIKQ